MREEEEGCPDEAGTPESSAAQAGTSAQQAVGQEAESVDLDLGDEVEGDLGHGPDPAEVADAIHPEPSASGQEPNAEADPGRNSGIASRTRSKSEARKGE